jgi:hypothetical protein
MLITGEHKLFPGGVRLGDVFDKSSPFYVDTTFDFSKTIAANNAQNAAYDAYIQARIDAAAEAKKHMVWDSSGKLINVAEVQGIVNQLSQPALDAVNQAQGAYQNAVAEVAAQSQAAVAEQATQSQAVIDLAAARNAAAAAEVARQNAVNAGNQAAAAQAEAARQAAQNAAEAAALAAAGHTVAAAQDAAYLQQKQAAAAAKAAADAAAAKTVVDKHIAVVTKNIITDGVVTTTDLTPASNFGTIALMAGAAFLLLRR